MRRPGSAAAIAATALAAMLLAAGCGSSTAARKPSGPGAAAVKPANPGAGARKPPGPGAGAAEPARPSTARAAGPPAEVAALLAGIPQRGNILGDPAAPVTLDYFGDLQCPFCREFTLGALATLIARYVRGGTLKIEYRSFETATRDPQIFRTQQVAALAAGSQNRLWNFIELFYREQGREDSGYVSESFLQGLAAQVGGLNLPDWSAARDDPALARAVSADERIALSVGLTATPAFLLANAAGSVRRFQPRTLTGLTPYRQAIEVLLRLDRGRGRGARPGSSS